MIRLTPREKEVLVLLAEGLLYKEIASAMGISVGNLKQKVHRIYKKLDANNRTEALNKYKKH
jgi:two-component system, NarL family, response regulator LiaR